MASVSRDLQVTSLQEHLLANLLIPQRISQLDRQQKTTLAGRSNNGKHIYNFENTFVSHNMTYNMNYIPKLTHSLPHRSQVESPSITK